MAHAHIYRRDHYICAGGIRYTLHVCVVVFLLLFIVLRLVFRFFVFGVNNLVCYMRGDFDNFCLFPARLVSVLIRLYLVLI